MRINKRNFLKFFTLVILAAVLAAAVFFYELISASGDIFSEGKKDNMSMVKEFSKMIVNPVEKLDGEADGQINVLLLGCGGEGHNGGQLTDTIIIASIKPDTHEAALLSIPRDLYVEVESTGARSKINAVKIIGDKGAQHNGIQLLEEVVEDISGLPIDYYIQLDFQGFIKIIDSVGGIDIYLENDINDPTYPNFTNGYDPFYIKKGWHHLDGATALKVARSRHSTMGDFDRIKRQQEVIKAFRQKIYEKYASADIGAFSGILSSVSGNLVTDIEPKEIPRFYQIMKDIRSSNITATTVDTQKYLQRINVGLGYTLSAKNGDYSAINELGHSLFDIEISEKEQQAIREEGALISIENRTGSPDTANIIAGDLEKLGLRIISSINAADAGTSGVVILYSKDGNKPQTLDFLVRKFSAKPELSKDEDSRADFTIVLGKGF
jgi:LCP family protein required for cell wall assembly